MSFALTTQQIIDRTKTVTRRRGWKNLKPGTLIRAVRKGMGLKPGESIEPLAILIVDQVHREPLRHMKQWCRKECAREGFPEMSPEKFIKMFCDHMGGDRDQIVTRIVFRYVPGGRLA